MKERKAPQAGAIKAEFDSKPYVLEIRSLPVPDGERLTVRVADQSIKLDNPQDIGMGEEMRKKLRDVCSQHGVLVAVGPPGSGTTTTLFALLRNVDAFIFTIVTLADTGGRKLPHVTEFEIDPQDDLATTITRASRREANVVLCDPIKSAAIAQGMFSKHDLVLMLAELVAKDTPTAVQQLIEWVGDPQVVATGLSGVVTQRLIRVLCPECKLAYKPKADFLRKIGLPEDVQALYRKPPDPAPQDANDACEKCGGMGYFGRTGMFEFLEMTEGMRALVATKPDAAAIRAQMKKDKMTTLQADGLRLVAEGRTSLEELQRVFKAG
jgi:type IV pilus assembly protein PilB